MLEQILLRNFRNYKEAVFSFCPYINRILGENGQGKTNLLEAIYFLSTGRSFRTHTISELIHQGEDYFYLEASFLKDQIRQTIKVFYQKNSKKIIYNYTTFPNFTPLLGILPSVLMAPSDIQLIHGSPLERRRFLNMHIAQIDPLYVYHLGRYHRALKQRNELLKQRKIDTLEIWETQMAVSGLYLMQKRSEFIKKLMQRTPFFLEKISQQKEHFSIRYCPSVSLDINGEDPIAVFVSIYKKNRNKEFELKTTILGPHRDDFSVYLEKKTAKIYSSEGQKRSIVAALKCAEWDRLKEKNEDDLPMMHIDDFGIHLDQQRLEFFQKILENKGQVFLTMPLEFTKISFQKEEKAIVITKETRGRGI